MEVASGTVVSGAVLFLEELLSGFWLPVAILSSGLGVFCRGSARIGCWVSYLCSDGTGG